MNDEATQHKQAVSEQIKRYRKLNKINSSSEFDEYFDLLIETCAQKMIWAFTGENIKTMDDFFKVRGEIISYLYPIQEVRGAKTMVKTLQKQLDDYYNQSA